jgi:hypothetical protein
MNAYRVFGEWKTRQVMEKHFKKKSFKVLVGAAKVLGSGFEMSIGETLEKGSYPVARKNQTLSRERQNDVYQVLNRSQTWDLLRAEMNQPRESYKKSTIE